MKKTVWFSLVLILSVAMGITGLAWAQIKVYEPVVTPKTVFISSQAYVGNLGGLSGADQLCQQLASRAGLTGTYKAWLADTIQGTPVTRWQPSAGPYRLRNGATVANSWNEIITTAKILTPINLDEFGRQVSLPPHDPFSYIWVWTGMHTTKDNTGQVVWTASTTANCGQWRRGSAIIDTAVNLPRLIGLCGAAGGWNLGSNYTAGWTALYENIDCFRPDGHIYCFQQ